MGIPKKLFLVRKFMGDFKKGVMRGLLKQIDYNEWSRFIKKLQDEGK